MLGGNHILDDNERFDPTVGCSLEGPMSSPRPCTGRSRSSRPSSRLAAFIAPTAMSEPGLGSYQRTATRETLGKASEQRKTLST